MLTIIILHADIIKLQNFQHNYMYITCGQKSHFNIIMLHIDMYGGRSMSLYKTKRY